MFGAVEQVLLPGDRNQLDAPATLAESLPKFLMGGSPGMHFGRGCHARVDVGKNGAVLADSDGHLDVEITNAAVARPE